MVILIDTNVILDYIAKREPYNINAYKIIEMCMTNKIKGCIAAHSITNLFYILRKDMSVKERNNILLKLCRRFTIIGIDNLKLIKSLENDDFNDLEDCLQYECALVFNADYIVTRNLCDFKGSKIKVVEPSEFLSKLTLLEKR